MDYLAHGYCAHCGKFCGCSYNPESLSDYCAAHRPHAREPLTQADIDALKAVWSVAWNCSLDRSSEDFSRAHDALKKLETLV